MSNPQAVRLGALIARARQAKGLSYAQLHELTGYATGWLARLEHGEFAEPGAERLTRLAELLDIPPEKLDRASKGRVGNSLPDMQTYFRAKHGLTPEQVERIERYVKRMRGKSP